MRSTMTTGSVGRPERRFRHEAKSAYNVLPPVARNEDMGIFTVRVRGRARAALTTGRASA
jgi:hypothetical protein